MAKVEFINKLLNYWERNHIPLKSNHRTEIINILNNLPITLPKDFQELYKNIDVGTLDCDDRGFLFYGREDIITMGKKFSLEKSNEFYNIVIFVDYMQASWWYGVNINKDNYEIGIIPNKGRFKPIANSLEIFIDLYIEDSEILYDYD